MNICVFYNIIKWLVKGKPLIEYARVDGQYKRLKFIGDSDVIKDYTAEFHSQVWDFDTTEINEDIINNLVEFDVDIRYAIDLRSMMMSFNFTTPTNAARANWVSGLTNYARPFSWDSFLIIDRERDRDTGGQAVAAAAADGSLANARVYAIRPLNLITRLEFYLNNSFVGQIPHTRTQMPFPEHVMVSSILYGTTPLPKPASTNDVLPATIERFEFYRFLNSDLMKN